MALYQSALEDEAVFEHSSEITVRLMVENTEDGAATTTHRSIESMHVVQGVFYHPDEGITGKDTVFEVIGHHATPLPDEPCSTITATA